MPRSGTLVGLFFVAVIGVCSLFFAVFPVKPAATPEIKAEDGGHEKAAAVDDRYEMRRLETRMSAHLFPAATEVRLFAWDFTGERGKAEQVVPEGVKLTDAEVASLRKSVWFAEEPQWIAACCVPRHSFKFYDKTRKEIGELQVCFECYCASITGEKPPKETHSWVDWDMKALKQIVQSHGIAADFQ